jgi:single-stranded DNA-binding protein
LNSCNFIGRMVRDAEDIKGDGVRFTIAVDVYNSQTKTREPVWVPCVAFGKVVGVIKDYAPKGKLVRVTGEYRQREYTATSGPNSGQKVKDHSFMVAPIDGFELLSSGGGNGGEKDDQPEGW